MTGTERLLSVTRVYPGFPSHQTTTPGPTVRTAATVTLVRRAASIWGCKVAELGVEKQSGESRGCRCSTAVGSRANAGKRGTQGAGVLTPCGRMLFYREGVKFENESMASIKTIKRGKWLRDPRFQPSDSFLSNWLGLKCTFGTWNTSKDITISANG